MDSQTLNLISHIELQSEMISKNVVEISQKLQYRVDEAKVLSQQSTECFEDALKELYQEIELLTQSVSNTVAVMQEISLDSDSVDRLRNQIRDINIALDLVEKKA